MLLRNAAMVVMLLASAACVQSFDATSLGVPATMSAPAGDQPQGEAFKVNQSGVYAFWGLLTLTSPSLEKVLAAQLVGGKSVSNLKMKVYSKWSDLLISALTLGIVVPRTVTFEGVIGGGVPAATQPPPE